MSYMYIVHKSHIAIFKQNVIVDDSVYDLYYGPNRNHYDQK